MNRASMMKVSEYTLSPPPLDELARVLSSALEANYRESSVTVTDCPDLRHTPFNLPFAGLTGTENIADIGGQGDLFPYPQVNKIYPLLQCARLMGMSHKGGSIVGAGAAPSLSLGTNAEMAPCLSWENGFDNCVDMTRAVSVSNANKQAQHRVRCQVSQVAECGLMANLYGSDGQQGPVLKITARSRKEEGKSFTELMRGPLENVYGTEKQISLGDVFIMKSGTARYHIMPDFPPKDQLPFKDNDQLNQWLTYHDFSGPMICFTNLRSSDPENIGVRLEHTHCFYPSKMEEGHYHFDVAADDEENDVEYEGYFNTAKTFFQIDCPDVRLGSAILSVQRIVSILDKQPSF